MKIPLVIIGGGIIGLSIAYRLNLKYPDLDFVLIDKEKILGDETTGRNSGVLHAGIYYEEGSLKHRLCIEGNRLWHEDQDKLGLRINNCGKYIISSKSSSSKKFDDLYIKAKEINNILGISLCSRNELLKLENYIHCENAFFSKTTSILSVPDAIKSLEDYLYKKNIPILKENQIQNLEHNLDNGFLVKTNREEFYTQKVINAAGLGAVKIRKMLGLSNIEDYFVKGNYLKLNKSFYNDSLLYPLPPDSQLGLGVHTSFDIEGAVRFGPNVEFSSSKSYNMSEDVIDKMYSLIKKTFKNIKKEDLSLDYCGIRPKIKVNGELYSDFWIKDEKEHDIRNYYELLGIESPGLTSAPAIANYIISLLNIE